MLRSLIAALGLTTTAASAVTLSLQNAQFDTSAVALAGATADFQSAATPSDPLPLLSSATAVPAGSLDFASGGAIAAAGLLSTSAEADSASGVASGVGSAHVLGTFGDKGILSLRLDFNSTNATLAPAFSLGSLFLLVTT